MVEAIIGTPVRAAARAVARSPCPSCAHRAMTPTGAIIAGDGRLSPRNSTDKSRSAAPTNMRGISPQLSKAVTLTRWVRSSPAPPATYDHIDGGIAACALASSSANDMGSDGRTPDRPWK